MSKDGMAPDYSDYPFIRDYSKSEGITEDILAEAFKIEEHYHHLLLEETEFDKRQILYSEFYSKLLSVYGRHEELYPEDNPKDKTVHLFEKELNQKSVIDFGCGQGYMLQSICKKLNASKLTGVDVYIPDELKADIRINFEAANIVKYTTDTSFEVAISDNVVEHLVPEDAKTHLEHIYGALSNSGKLILIMPNRLFGPADITRIQDFSHAGKLDALGGHVNESTYTEMIAILKSVGFRKFSTVLPIPKFKYTLLRKVRVGTGWITTIEKSKFLLRLFRAVKIKGVCPIRFTVTLIAEK